MVRECCFGQTCTCSVKTFREGPTLCWLSYYAACSSLRPILASNTKRHMYQGLRMAALTPYLETWLIYSSPYSHRPPPDRPPRFQPHSPTCCSAQASAGHHRIGGVPFSLLCQTSRDDNSPYLRQWQEEVPTLLPRPRGCTNPCRPAHSGTFCHKPCSVGAQGFINPGLPRGCPPPPHRSRTRPPQ